MKVLLLTLLVLIAGTTTATFTLMEVADLTIAYPKTEIDIGIGIGYTLFDFANDGTVRGGVYGAWDVNLPISHPDWISAGVFIAREIQVNITLGVMAGCRFGEGKLFQAAVFLGFDVWPWRLP